MPFVRERCNQPKSLSGIETSSVPSLALSPGRCNQPKSLSGIETGGSYRTPHPQSACCNQPKSLSGIET